MAGHGVHFAPEASVLETIRQQGSSDALFDYLGEMLDAHFQSGFDAETDKAWWIIHQTLIGLPPKEPYCIEARPNVLLSQVIMGHEQLSSEDWFMVNVTPAANVPEIWASLSKISEAEFCEKLSGLITDDASSTLTSADVEYAGYWFEHLKPVFEAATLHKRGVVFTVDY